MKKTNIKPHLGGHANVTHIESKSIEYLKSKYYILLSIENNLMIKVSIIGAGRIAECYIKVLRDFGNNGAK